MTGRRCSLSRQCFPCEQQKPGLLVKSGEDMVKINWLVVSTPLKNISHCFAVSPEVSTTAWQAHILWKIKAMLKTTNQ